MAWAAKPDMFGELLLVLLIVALVVLALLSHR